MRLSFLLGTVLLFGCSSTSAVASTPDAETPAKTNQSVSDILQSLFPDPTAPQTLIKGGKIYLEDEINAASVASAIASLKEMESKVLVNEVEIILDSPGGLIDEGFKLSKAIERSRLRTVCIVDGTAASMAFYILQSCTERVMTHRSVLMIHEPAFGVRGKPQDIHDAWRELEVSARAFAAHSADRMGMPIEDFIKKTSGHDWWMASDEALMVHAVDRVVVSPNVRTF